LPDSIPAKVYTSQAANSAVTLAEEIVEFIAAKIKDMETWWIFSLSVLAMPGLALRL